VVLTGLPTDIEVSTDPLVAAHGIDNASTTTTRSDVASSKADVDAAQAALGRERGAILPPVGLGAFYESDDGRAVAGAMITMQLPLWKQNQGEIAAARGDLMLARADLQAAEGRAQVQTDSATGRLEAAAHAESLLTTDLSQDAAAALSSIQSAYTLGETDLNTALLLQARVIEGEQGWYAARASMAETRIDVALATEDPALMGTR
jgi:outer membrane protein TolC